MDTCKRRIKNTGLGFGIVETYDCYRPVFKDGLCKMHYEKSLAKSTPYKDREGYRQPNEKEFKTKLLYLKTSGSYGGHRYRNGVIMNLNGINPKSTNIPGDPSLFVIKI